eukprot:GHVS01076513.1.p1 GENE.GHVS01076513.1~~GHVS01076513.1.p1  ORF type:complete len:441 (+),score=6.37 GHVS01076513.1:33-1325(+)
MSISSITERAGTMSDNVSAVWEWESDGGWVCFEKNICESLEAAFVASNTSCSYSMSPWTYVIDFHSMKQTNRSTGRVRDVRQLCSSQAVWMWQGDYRHYRRYDDRTTVALEQLFSSNSPVSKLIGPVYTVDVSIMEQVNLASGFKRKVRRWMICPAPRIASASFPLGAAQSSTGPAGVTSLSAVPVSSKRVEPRLLESGVVECFGSDGTICRERASSCLEALDKFPNDVPDQECVICIEDIVDEIVRIKKCGHIFHRDCIESWLSKGCKAAFECPKCKRLLLRGFGDCPRGTMTWELWENKPEYELDGYPGTPTAVISYVVASGIQSIRHPQPGASYAGICRKAYLPYTDESKPILKMLVYAFSMGHTFTVGTSVTTGTPNSVVWNGIHHKTRTNGGAAHFGFPDEQYLGRLLNELKAKGICHEVLENPS